eukprot:m.380729 g.380729  ORF g.380729 m.380729 type:complete len:110 (-) comp56235_c0_seq17:424-753(-)
MSADYLQLYGAAKKGDTTQIERLISRGLPPDAHNEYLVTALHVASWCDQAASAEILLDMGANIEAQCDISYLCGYCSNLVSFIAGICLFVFQVVLMGCTPTLSTHTIQH